MQSEELRDTLMLKLFIQEKMKLSKLNFGSFLEENLILFQNTMNMLMERNAQKNRH